MSDGKQKERQQKERLQKLLSSSAEIPPAQGPLALQSKPTLPLPPHRKQMVWVNQVAGSAFPGPQYTWAGFCVSKHELSPTYGTSLHFTYTWK